MRRSVRYCYGVLANRFEQHPRVQKFWRAPPVGTSNISCPLMQPTTIRENDQRAAILSHPSAGTHSASEYLNMSSLPRAEEDGSEQEGSEPDYLGEGACCAHATPSDPGPRWYSATSVFPPYNMSASEEWNRTRRQRWASGCGVDLSEPEPDSESDIDSEELEAAEAAETAEAWVRMRSQMVTARASALEGGKHNESEADLLLRKYTRRCAAALARRSKGQEPVASANPGEPKTAPKKSVQPTHAARLPLVARASTFQLSTGLQE